MKGLLTLVYINSGFDCTSEVRPRYTIPFPLTTCFVTPDERLFDQPDSYRDSFCFNWFAIIASCCNNILCCWVQRIDRFLGNRPCIFKVCPPF